jgi:hypothetical protein
MLHGLPLVAIPPAPADVRKAARGAGRGAGAGAGAGAGTERIRT